MQRLNCNVNKAVVLVANSLNRRCFATRLRSNHYETLGLARSATQAEVKAAYYSLSKQFHPDRNENDEIAADRFRQITEAYEVLGNFRLRKLYDKGMLHTAGDNLHNTPEPQPFEEDDPTTRFYKARMSKEKVNATGRTSIYDFDEWTNSHYGDEYKRQQKLKYTSESKRDRVVVNKQERKTESVIILFVLLFGVICAFSGKNYDVDNTLKVKKTEADQG